MVVCNVGQKYRPFNVCYVGFRNEPCKFSHIRCNSYHTVTTNHLVALKRLPRIGMALGLPGGKGCDGIQNTHLCRPLKMELGSLTVSIRLSQYYFQHQQQPRDL